MLQRSGVSAQETAAASKDLADAFTSFGTVASQAAQSNVDGPVKAALTQYGNTIGSVGASIMSAGGDLDKVRAAIATGETAEAKLLPLCLEAGVNLA